MRRFLLEVLIALLRKELADAPITLTKEQEDGLLSQLWQNPAFRKRIADRDAKLIYTMAGGEGMQPEPREAYTLHAGQRVENLLLARDAKKAYERTKARIELATAQKASVLSPEQSGSGSRPSTDK